MRHLVALALLLSPVAANEMPDAAKALAIAREELKSARGEWTMLAKVEKEALRDARAAIAATTRGRALAPAFLAAADLLEGARGAAGDGADLIAQMALSYRAMAEELDRKAAWRLVKRGDPRYRALAYNMKELNAALASLGEREGALGTALEGVAKLNKALAPCFEGVETARPEPPEEDCPT